jgi:hypothetical protein
MGAAIAGAGALIAKNVQSLARIESINAQTAQTIKSMGNAAGISATGIQELAGSLEQLTATEAETIQEGANLLLTFKNIKNQAGAGNDIFTQTTGIMVDLARAMGTSASGEAIRLGKALNDPIRGLSALTRVGVSFTEEQRAQVKALQESGDLMGAQKIILAELQAQFGGSGAAYAKTFSGQLDLMGHELGTIGEEATLSVLPALQGMVGEFRALIPLIGPQLKAAIESVDWKALAESVVGFTTFLITNAGTIARVVAAIFILNTAYKVMQVGIGIVNVALALKTWYLAQTAAGMTAATIASGALSSALKLIPFVAVATAAAYLATEIANSGPKFDAYKTAIQGIDTSASEAEVNLLAFGLTATDIGGKINPLVSLINTLTKSLLGIPKSVTSTVTVVTRNISTGFGGADVNAWRAGLPKIGGNVKPPKPIPVGGAAPKTKKQTLAQQLKKDARLVTLEKRLQKQGLSEGLAGTIISTGGAAEARKTLDKIANTAGKYGKNIQKLYNKTKAGQAELKASTEKTNEALTTAPFLGGGGGAKASTGTSLLDKRKAALESFSEAVKNTFAGIRDSILNAFELPKLGSSITGIIRNMGKLLTTTRGFADNIKKLSAMGLNAELLQQIIAQGPMAGAKLAASLVAGGAASLGEINQAYSEFGNLASDIATSGTNALFGTQAQQNIYNIEVNGGVGSGPTIGQAIVDAIRAYERTSGAVWQRA